MQSSAAAQQSLADQAAQSRADAQAASDRASRSNGDQTGGDAPAPQSDNGG